MLSVPLRVGGKGGTVLLAQRGKGGRDEERLAEWGMVKRFAWWTVELN